jgi:hypothetical protein
MVLFINYSIAKKGLVGLPTLGDKNLAFRSVLYRRLNFRYGYIEETKTVVERSTLIQEIESLPPQYYGEVIDFVSYIKEKK